MKYYIMSQDKRIQNPFVLKEFPTSASVDLDTSYGDQLRDHTSLFTIENEGSAYPEMLEAPLVMVEKKIHDVLEMYDETVVYKTVSIINQKKNTRREYYIALIDRIDCLHSTTEFYKDNSLKKLVLDREKIKDRQIFKVAGISSPYVIVSLDIAESILRRGCFGVRFEEVECK